MYVRFSIFFLNVPLYVYKKTMAITQHIFISRRDITSLVCKSFHDSESSLRVIQKYTFWVWQHRQSQCQRICFINWHSKGKLYLHLMQLNSVWIVTRNLKDFLKIFKIIVPLKGVYTEKWKYVRWKSSVSWSGRLLYFLISSFSGSVRSISSHYFCTSRDQYFHIQGPVLKHPLSSIHGAVLSHPGTNTLTSGTSI